MEDRFTNRVNMTNATIGFSDANASITAGLTAHGNALTVVKGKIVLVNGLNQIAGGSTKGVTTDTNLLRKVMTDMALKCANGTTAYANSVNNNTLKALVNFNQRKLDKYKKEDVDDVCQGIRDAANANIGSLGGFGIVAADVSDLQTAINLYRIATQNPRQAIITKSQAGKQAREIVQDIIVTYFEGIMDPIVNTLKLTQPNFWSGYQQARKVIDLGSTTAKVRGTVLNMLNVPLQNVAFKIFDTGTATLVKQVLTDNLGRFNSAKLPAGDFDFKWELTGYIPKIETNVHIGPGKELQRKVKLVAGSSNITREVDVASSGIANVPVLDINPTPLTTVTIEASHPLRVFGANSPGSAPGPGNPFWDVPAGIVTKSLVEFGMMTGINDMNQFLNVQNLGMATAHFKITFSNLA